jgi:hypothetical protein
VRVDDCYSGPDGTVAGTTFGPRWPELRIGGAVYFEQSFAQALPVALRPRARRRGALGHQAM